MVRFNQCTRFDSTTTGCKGFHHCWPLVAHWDSISMTELVTAMEHGSVLEPPPRSSSSRRGNPCVAISTNHDQPYQVGNPYNHGGFTMGLSKSIVYPQNGEFPYHGSEIGGLVGTTMENGTDPWLAQEWQPLSHSMAWSGWWFRHELISIGNLYPVGG